MKKREPFIFSDHFFNEADKAVQRAIDSSAAAGLPKSYLDSFEQLRQDKPQDQPTVTKRAVNE